MISSKIMKKINTFFPLQKMSIRSGALMRKTQQVDCMFVSTKVGRIPLPKIDLTFYLKEKSFDGKKFNRFGKFTQIYTKIKKISNPLN